MNIRKLMKIFHTNLKIIETAKLTYTLFFQCDINTDTRII